jgi:glycosyltransferase involved in cell wall biosynthesis
MIDAKVFICGTTRNSEMYLDAVFQTIQKIQSIFSDSHIIISFDQSTDKTLLKLAQYKRAYGDKMDICLNRNPLSPRRTENIANARNRILERMRELMAVSGSLEEDPAPYFIMMDTDDVSVAEPDLDVIRRAIDRKNEWDAISFNRPGYYDIWALSIKPYIYSCWGWNDAPSVVKTMRNYIIKLLKDLNPEELLECQSAFGGFAIYKTDPFLKCAYDWRMPKQYMSATDLKKNHKTLGY